MVNTELIRTVVGIIGNVISLGLFLAPVPTFVRICKKRSVEEFSPMPYLATMLNCMVWVVYGLPIVHPHSTLVLTINGAGLFIELAYLLLFIIFSKGGKRLKVIALFIAEIVFIIALAIIVITVVHTWQRRSMIVGIISVVFCIGMYVAPLSVMRMVIQTKSVEFMPLTLSVVGFLNGVCWTTYALIRFDLYITIPNSVGTLFAVAQLVLYAVYYKSTKRQMEERKRKAELGMTEVAAGSKVGSAPYNGGDIP
ncbi:bidirectional sugar transporter SWEET4-like [Canna indica]|uniref:Bidirectional sugar transporter SWEET n=1 Tax=Canna indica TaxID=4628 RepID=A0AAQ3KGR7_9LILI|nr:bidirectional sugar transporter SWEET4-like [Canna indica]